MRNHNIRNHGKEGSRTQLTRTTTNITSFQCNQCEFFQRNHNMTNHNSFQCNQYRLFSEQRAQDMFCLKGGRTHEEPALASNKFFILHLHLLLHHPMTTQPAQEYYAGQKLVWPKILCWTKNGDIGICLSIKCACNTQILKSAARYVGTISCPL